MTDEEKRSEEAEATGAAEVSSSEASTDSGVVTASSHAEDVTLPGFSAEDVVKKTDEVETEKPPSVAAAAHDHGDHGHDHGGHDHGDHGHGHSHGEGDHHEHLGHTAPMSLLIGVLVALGLLTVLTVAVTAIDLGSEGNFIVAMIIATVKAVLVMGYFMHMFWDSKFNVVAFTSSFLFVLLFLAMTLLDRAEYQPTIDRFENDKKALM